jgi:predicted outer membrane repeat protein
MLATPGTAKHYVGNWLIETRGTSTSLPLTLEPGPGVSGPILDGDRGKATGCGTRACNGVVLVTGPGAHVVLDNLTIENADDTGGGRGGGALNERGAHLVVSDCTFRSNKAGSGGAIYNGAGAELSVKGSMFSANSAKNGGGAIDNGDNSGKGTASVSSSTFSANAAGAGGAIANALDGGSGTLSVTTSTFSANKAGTSGGAISNDDGRTSVSNSAFTDNQGDFDGGAISNGSQVGAGLMTVSGSTFSLNSSDGYGGAISNGVGSSGSLGVWSSTFYGNEVGSLIQSHARLQPAFFVLGEGGAIDNGDDGGNGYLALWSSTFEANGSTSSNSSHEDTIDDGVDGTSTGKVWAAANIFDGGCGVLATWHDLGYNVGEGCTYGGKDDAPPHGNLGALLGHLARNGGPTETILPLSGNLAIGIVPYGTAALFDGQRIVLCPATDQRGVPSAAGQRCDAGAVQLAHP